MQIETAPTPRFNPRSRSHHRLYVSIDRSSVDHSETPEWVYAAVYTWQGIVHLRRMGSRSFSAPIGEVLPPATPVSGNIESAITIHAHIENPTGPITAGTVHATVFTYKSIHSSRAFSTCDFVKIFVHHRLTWSTCTRSLGGSPTEAVLPRSGARWKWTGARTARMSIVNARSRSRGHQRGGLPISLGGTSDGPSSRHRVGRRRCRNRRDPSRGVGLIRERAKCIRRHHARRCVRALARMMLLIVVVIDVLMPAPWDIWWISCVRERVIIQWSVVLRIHGIARMFRGIGSNSRRTRSTDDAISGERPRSVISSGTFRNTYRIPNVLASQRADRRWRSKI